MRVRQAFCKGLQGSLIVLLTAGSLHVGAADSYYRWLDNRGNPVHSDRPPPAGVDYEVVSTRSGLKRVVTGEQGAVPREVVPTVSNEFEPVPRVASPSITQNPEICRIARSNLTTVTEFARVETKDSQGNMRYLTEEERLAEITKAEELIGIHCE